MYYTTSNRKFKIGDKVRIIENCSVWNVHIEVTDRVGKVLRLEKDDQSLDIVAVKFDGFDTIVRAYSGHFEAD